MNGVAGSYLIYRENRTGRRLRRAVDVAIAATFLLIVAPISILVTKRFGI